MFIPLLGMVLVALIWGSVTLFSIWSGLPSPVFVFYRVAIALPFVLTYALKKRGRKVFKFTWVSFLSGIFLSLNWVFFFEAVSRIDISTAVLLYYFGPVFAVLLSWLLLKEEMKPITWIPVLLAFTGIILIFASSSIENDLPGVIFGVLAGLSYGSLAVCGKAVGEKLKSEVLVTQQLIVSTLVLLPFAFGSYELNLNALFNVTIVGVVHTGAALVIWFTVLRKLPMRVASVLSYLDPVFATFLAWIVFGQIPSISTISGGALIIAAGILVSTQYRSETRWTTVNDQKNSNNVAS